MPPEAASLRLARRTTQVNPPARTAKAGRIAIGAMTAAITICAMINSAGNVPMAMPLAVDGRPIAINLNAMAVHVARPMPPTTTTNHCP